MSNAIASIMQPRPCCPTFGRPVHLFGSTPLRSSCTDYAFGFPCRPGGWLAWLVSPGYRRGPSVLARVVSRRVRGSQTTSGLRRGSRFRPCECGLPSGSTWSVPEMRFRGSIPGPSMPLSTLPPAPHSTQRKTRGRVGSLFLFSCAPSSPTTRRFIPMLALPYGRGSVAALTSRYWKDLKSEM